MGWGQWLGAALVPRGFWAPEPPPLCFPAAGRLTELRAFVRIAGEEVELELVPQQPCAEENCPPPSTDVGSWYGKSIG